MLVQGKRLGATGPGNYNTRQPVVVGGHRRFDGVRFVRTVRRPLSPREGPALTCRNHVLGFVARGRCQRLSRVTPPRRFLFFQVCEKMRYHCADSTSVNLHSQSASFLGSRTSPSTNSNPSIVVSKTFPHKHNMTDTMRQPIECIRPPPIVGP
ncbi:hypothetical protein GQ53DRAFT_325498 [Thozetella sp. PMI_491]|nr:hypothetical protein GQ53DRAFT_325498 [Thozetella sp. PMI_491]